MGFSDAAMNDFATSKSSTTVKPGPRFTGCLPTGGLGMGGASSSGGGIEVCCLRFISETKEIGGGKHTGRRTVGDLQIFANICPGIFLGKSPLICPGFFFCKKKPVVPARKHIQFLQILTIKLAKMGFRACIPKLGSFRGGPPCVKFANVPR